MSEDNPADQGAEESRALLHAAWAFAGTQKRSRPLQITEALSELSEWLGDARQCQNAGRKNWQSQLQDVERSLEFVITLTKGDARDELERLCGETKKARGQVRTRGGISEWTRSSLQLIVAELEHALDQPGLVGSAFDLTCKLAAASPHRAVQAVHATVDLACRRGLKTQDVISEVKRALTGNHDSSPSDCIAAARHTLIDARPRMIEIVWLHVVEARLNEPPVLEIGDAFLFVADSVFVNGELGGRGLFDRAPELVDLEDRSLLFPRERSGSSDVDEGTQPEAERDDPKAVYVRIRIPPTPEPRAYERASQQLDFLLGLASTESLAENIWISSGSHWLVGGRIRSTNRWYDPVAAWKAGGSDEVARVLAGYADRLAPHFPLTDERWKTAGLLLSWLRQASHADAATSLILCDRVLEQVAGWAGFDDPQQLVEGPIRSAWCRSEALNALDVTYIHLLNAADWSRPIPSAAEIVVDRPAPPHSAPSALPTRSRGQIVALVDQLAEEVPRGTPAALHVRRLQELFESKAKTNEFLDSCMETFDRRNAHLRRTRNALLHGGPIVTSSVDHVSGFALTLANFALGGALEVMLDGRDLTVGLIEDERVNETCLRHLRSGSSWPDALFREPMR